MKTNKLVKLGIATFAVAVLGVVPAFTAQADTHVAEQPNTASKPVENGKPSDSEKPEVKPAEEVKPESKPSETPKPEVKPEPAPKADENQEPIKYRINYFDADTGSEISKELGVLNPGETINTHKNIDGYEVVTKRSWMPDYNVDYRLMNRYFGYSTDGYRYIYLDYKKVNASETPKPEPAPKTDENQEPIKYRIDYFNADTGERISREIGVLNPGETINIHKNIDGYEVVTKRSWMPDYNVDYRLMDRYFGSTSSYRYMFLEYKKVNADAKPSETPKPEVKPEPAPKDKEQQKPLKYFIDYLDADTGEQISHEIGVLKPGETINIYKDIEGYEVVSYYGWMPGYKVNYRIMNRYFGFSNGYDYMFLHYKKVNADAKPSETPKPEVKPETKPSETPKPEEKPETKPSDTSKPEVKPETKPSDTSKPEVKPETKPSETPKPEVKPETKPSDTPKPEVKPAPKPSETPKPEVKPETKPSETPKPEVKPAPKPSETPKPEVKPEPKPSDTSKPEVKPEPKPSETPKPEVKPETKPSDTPKPEVKPAPKPSDTPKPEVKPEPKPSDTSKPEVKPEPKPSDTSKAEVKPELKPQTNSNTAPTAPVKPVGQTSNSKADKPTSKKETPSLPNTGEQSSSLSLVGLLLASLGLAGLTYKGRH